MVDYSYIGQRVARRAYNTTTTVNTDYSYDNLGRITDITAGSLVDFHYDYVADENNIWKKRFDHRTNTPYNQYSYDDIDRVTGITYHDSDTEAFYMDDLGNRSGNQTLREDGTTNFTVDSATNRYTSIAGNTITHDNTGNLTTDKDDYTHEYDCENRIIKIKDSTNAEVATFAYDALNRRIRKVDSKATKTTLNYYSDKWQVLKEYDGSGNSKAMYVYGNYIDEVLYTENTSGIFYYLHDHLFSPVALIDTSGTVVERYEYNAYGKATVYTNMLDWNTATPTTQGYSAVDNPYLFTGRRLDNLHAGAYEIMYYRNRYYDTEMGRFLTYDPLGYVDSMNFFEYVNSHPMSNTDPMGLNLYAIGGTGEVYSDKINVAKVHDSYLSDGGPKLGLGKYYWDGPDKKISGDDSDDIERGVRRQICKDYCSNKRVQINLCGWSRGGAIALAVAKNLNTVGCFCCGKSKGSYFWAKPITVNWIGLFDAVRMTNSIPKPLTLDNVTRISHATKTTKKEPWFPIVNISGGNVRKRYFYKKDGSATNHSDMGRGDMSLKWIKKQGSALGLVF